MKRNKYEDTRLLVALLDIDEEQYNSKLYQLSEIWEDRHMLSGMYSHLLFRNWWRLRANMLAQNFNDKIIYRENEIMLHLHDEEGDTFIDCQHDIKKCFFHYLENLKNTPVDNALLELIYLKEKAI